MASGMTWDQKRGTSSSSLGEISAPSNDRAAGERPLIFKVVVGGRAETRDTEGDTLCTGYLKLYDGIRSLNRTISVFIVYF